MTQNISNIQPNMQIYNQNQYAQAIQNPNFAANGTPISNGAAINNNPILKQAESAQDSGLGKLAIGTAVFTPTLMGLTNLINKPLLTNNYEDTFFNKIEQNVNKFGEKPKVSAVTGWLSNVKTKANNVVNNSEILRTLFHKPSIGGSQVESQAKGSRGHLASRAIEIMKKYKKENPNFTEFDDLLKKCEKESYNYYDEIFNKLKDLEKRNILKPQDLNTVFSKKPWWGLGIVNNKSSLREILNKHKLIENYKTGTKLGQKASGYLIRAAECLTNGMFSGKGAVLLQAFFIAQSLQEASKAEKGEKFSSFMASFAELMAMMATIGIQMRVVNHLAGLKNIGMTPENVKAAQNAVKAANAAAKAGNMAEYTKQVNLAKSLKNVSKTATNGNKALKWYQKPIKWLGNLISFGRINETIKPLKNSKVATAFAKIPYGLKVGLGYAGRVGLIMAVVMPFFSGIAKKISYGIFGKPTKTLAKEKAAEEAENKPQEQQPVQNTNAQQTTQQTPQQTVTQPANVQQPQMQQNPQAKPGNLLDTVQRNQAQRMPQNQTQNPIASQTLQPQSTIASTPIHKSPEDEAGVKRSYVPSPVLGYENPINPAMSRSAQIDAVLRQADIVEANAARYL